MKSITVSLARKENSIAKSSFNKYYIKLNYTNMYIKFENDETPGICTCAFGFWSRNVCKVVVNFATSTSSQNIISGEKNFLF